MCLKSGGPLNNCGFPFGVPSKKPPTKGTLTEHTRKCCKLAGSQQGMSWNDPYKVHPPWFPLLWHPQTVSFPTPGLGHSLPEHQANSLQVNSRCQLDSYTDVAFIFIARDCGSSLWWAHGRREKPDWGASKYALVPLGLGGWGQFVVIEGVVHSRNHRSGKTQTCQSGAL